MQMTPVITYAGSEISCAAGSKMTCFVRRRLKNDMCTKALLCGCLVQPSAPTTAGLNLTTKLQRSLLAAGLGDEYMICLYTKMGRDRDTFLCMRPHWRKHTKKVKAGT
jgi:hypothetical protein